MAVTIQEFIAANRIQIERQFMIGSPVQAELPGEAVLDGGLHALLDRYLAGFPAGTDRRGIASLWSAIYFNRFPGPVVGAALVAGRLLPVGFGESGLIPTDDGCHIAAIRIPHGGVPIKGDVFARLHALVREHLDPLIRSISAWARVSPKVLWGIVGNGLDWTLRDIAALPEMQAEHIAEFNRIMIENHWPDGWRNPLFEPVRYVDSPEGLRREKRVCCLRYLLPNDDFCSICPSEVVAKARKACLKEAVT
ncbi:siderophore-iron reductase FhuF [Agrobacterium tumefaciens]|uniref:siderophore-iron reductase FhuF n=1 Tax=Agrobacterium tumefaciens TaxID=358 RepID=UPI0022445829|nr:siderophore-iron reductase FhuF [Agrobacterium tumefaciens]MCW8057242.1 siderophore-iron reductase FhuF [Agrobacterium tumefaciens]